MPPSKKSPEEAARLAEARAKQGQEQFQPPAKKKAAYKPTPEEIWTAVNSTNELGDALIVIKNLSDRYVCDKARGMIFRFNGQHWELDVIEEAAREATHYLNQIYREESNRLNGIANSQTVSEEERKTAEARRDAINKRIRAVNTRRRMENVLSLAATGEETLAINGDQWNRDPWALPVSNGVVDLKNGLHRPGRPEDFINKCAPAEWIGLHAEAKAWEAFMASIFDGNHELVTYVQKVFGAAIVGLAKQQEFYILFGEGRNGKGTLIETIKEVLGPLADPIRSELIMESRFQQGGGGNPELLDLQGMRLVWASETKEGQALNVEKIKLFTGADTLKGRYHYSNNMIAFRPSHTLLLLTNHKPRVKASEYALWQRLRLIPFLLSFVDTPKEENERQKDHDLPEKLAKETSGILAWLVRGCLLWQREGLNPPATVLEATAEYQTSEDMIAHFIDDRCELDKASTTQAGLVYDAFKDWFKVVYGEKSKVPGLKTFSKEMQRKVKRSPGRITNYIGIRLKDA